MKMIIFIIMLFIIIEVMFGILDGILKIINHFHLDFYFNKRNFSINLLPSIKNRFRVFLESRDSISISTDDWRQFERYRNAKMFLRSCEGQIWSRIIAHDFSVTNLEIQCICIRKHRRNFRNSCRGETFEGWTVEIEAISNVFSSWHVQNRGGEETNWPSFARWRV